MNDLFNSSASLSSVTHPDHDDKDEFVVQLSQVDMLQKMRAVEHRFKDRYSFLKRAYEERLESLLCQIRVCDTAVQGDAIVQQLLATAETAGFASSRAHEVVVDTLGMEREKYIAQLTDRLGKCRAQLDEEREEHESIANKMTEQAKQYRHRVAQLKDNVTVTLSELQKSEVEREELNTRLADALQKEKQLAVSRTGERDIVNHARARLDVLLSAMHASIAPQQQLTGHQRQNISSGGNCQQEIQAGRSLLEMVNALEQTVQTWQHDVVRTNNSLAEAAATTARVEEDMNIALERSTSQVTEFKRELEHIKKENETVKLRNKELSRRLKTSEEERRDVRQQYVELGSKLEQAVLSDVDSKGKALQQSQQNCDRLKADLLNTERQINTLKKDLEIANSKIINKDERLVKLDKAVTAFKPTQIQDKQKIDQLEDQLTKYKHKLHRMKEKHKSDVSAIQRRLTESAKEHQRVQARMESEQERQVGGLKVKLKAAQDQMRAQERRADAESKREQQQQRQQYQEQLDQELKKVNRQYEVQLQQLQQQLELAVNREQQATAAEEQVLNKRRSRRSADVSDADEDDAMHHVAATRIANLIKDHMPVSQHEQIVEARLAALRSELTHEKSQAIAVAERDARAETVRLEERKDQEYSMSMLNIRQGIKKLEAQVEQERIDRRNLETSLQDERSTSNELRRRVDEEENNKQTLLSHLEEANGNILRLKSIVQQVTDRAGALEHEREMSDRELQDVTSRAVMLGEKLAVAEAHLNARSARVQELENDLRERAVEKTELSAHVATHKFALERTTLERDRLERLLEDSMQKRHDDDVHRVVRRDNEFTAETNGLRTRLEQEEKQLVEAKEQVVKLQNDKVANEARLDEFVRKDKESSQVFERNQRQLVEAEKQILQLEASVKDSEKSVVNLNGQHSQQLERSEEKIARLRQELDRATAGGQQAEYNNKKKRLAACRDRQRLLQDIQERIKPLKERLLQAGVQSRSEIAAMKNEMKQIVAQASWRFRASQGAQHARNTGERESIERDLRIKFDAEKKDMITLHETQIIQLRQDAEKRVDEARSSVVSRSESVALAVSQEQRLRQLAEDKVESVSVELENTKISLKQARDEKDSLNERLRKLDDQINQLSSDVSKKSQQLHDLRDSIENKNEMINDYQSQLDVHAARLSTLVMAIGSQLELSEGVVSALLQGVKHDAGRFAFDIKRLQDEIKALLVGKNVAGTETVMRPLREEISRLQSQVLEKQARIERVEESLGEATQAEHELKNKMAVMAEHSTGNDKTASGLNEHVLLLENEIERLTSELESEEAMFRMDIESKQRVHEAKLEELQEDMEVEKNILVRQHRAALQSATQGTDAQLEQARVEMDQRIRTIQIKLDQEKQKAADAQSQVWKLKSESHIAVESERTRVETLERSVRQTQRELDLERSRASSSRSLASSSVAGRNRDVLGSSMGSRANPPGSPGGMSVSSTSQYSAFANSGRREGRGGQGGLLESPGGSLRRLDTRDVELKYDQGMGATGIPGKMEGGREEGRGREARRRRGSSGGDNLSGLRRSGSMKLDVEDLTMNVHSNGEVDMSVRPDDDRLY